MNSMRRIRCAEIFGGNMLADTDLCTRGLTASVFSAASEGEQGGDVYYFSVCSSELLTRIAVLDMRGHGKEVSHLSEWLYKSLDQHMNSPGGSLRTLGSGVEAITTAAVLSYYIRDSKLYFSYAGHPPALVRRSAAGSKEVPIADTRTPANFPLGVLREVHFDQQALALEPDDRFFVHTDGIVGCPDASGRFFGEERLAAALEANASLPLQEMKHAIAARLRAWGGDSLAHDDSTFLVAEVATHPDLENRLDRDSFLRAKVLCGAALWAAAAFQAATCRWDRARHEIVERGALSSPLRAGTRFRRPPQPLVSPRLRTERTPIPPPNIMTACGRSRAHAACSSAVASGETLVMQWKALVAAVLLAGAAAAQQEHDLVVYGGTAGGVTTAVAGARHGLRTVLLEPGNHVGGMVSGGLSGTDVGRIEVIGGMALEFYWRAGRHYQLDRHLQQLAWMPEPGVAEKIMREMLADAKVTLLTGHRLVEKRGVIKRGTRVTEIVMENGARFRGRMFADASYEGDLMAQAGIGYTYGRESTSQYGESLAGVRAHTASHQFPVDISAYGEDGKLLPEISPEPRGEPGSADKRIQAYNFRVIGTNVPENRIPWEKPEGYDPKRYELLARYLAAVTKYLGRPPMFNEVSLFRVIPNGKADLNNRGPFSTDYIGKNYRYPEGTYAERAEIWKEHVLYQKGFYYFLANDPRVPKSLQEEVRQWGLAKDEFVYTANWPNQLYIREARRMVGPFVATQKDLQTERTKPDAIGMGSYNSDSHNVQRHVAEGGIVLNEGDVQVPVQPYQIPYRVLLPKKTEAENVLVPVCFSASHIAYSSLRMEPQYMIIGHAAGVAAALAIKGNIAVQDIPVSELQTILRSEGGVFEHGYEHQVKALAAIRNKFAPARRTGPSPWSRPAPAGRPQ